MPLDNVRQEMLLRCVASGESGFFSRLEWLRPLGPPLGHGMVGAKTRNAIQMGDPLASPPNQFQ